MELGLLNHYCLCITWPGEPLPRKRGLPSSSEGLGALTAALPKDPFLPLIRIASIDKAKEYRHLPRQAAWRGQPHTRTWASPPSPPPMGSEFPYYTPSQQSCQNKAHHVATAALAHADTSFLWAVL